MRDKQIRLTATAASNLYKMRLNDVDQSSGKKIVSDLINKEAKRLFKNQAYPNPRGNAPIGVS